MCRRIVSYLLLGFLLEIPIVADVSPQPGSESLPALFADSSLVFKGEITDIKSGGTTVAQFHGQNVLMDIFKAVARVDRLYKGALPAGAVTIVFTRPQGQACIVSICEALRVGEYDLFFLTDSGSEYKLLDKFFGKFAVSRINAQTDSKDAAGLKEDLVAGISDSDELGSLAAIELFGALGKVQSTVPLLRRYQQANLTKRAAILEALLRLHDYSRLKDLNDVFAIAPSSNSQLLSLQYRISFNVSEIRDSEAVPALLVLAKSPSDSLRESVLHALRHIGGRKAVPTLVAALDDPIELIRYDAVLGLATIEANWELAPSVGAFQQNESKYISAWKQWWRVSGRAQYSR